MIQKVSDYIFDFIVKQTQTRTVFMLPGGGCMHLVDSLGANKSLNYVCCLHEQAAAVAADAYASINKSLGVVLVTAGPGSTNAITGVTASWIDSTPVLVLSGQAKTADLKGNKGVRQFGIQEVDITSMVGSVTKYARCVTDVSRIRYELERAVWLATHGRKGPVWLDLPLDVQGAYIDPDMLEGFCPSSETVPCLDGFIDQLLSSMYKAKKPLIYAGYGVKLACAEKEFVTMVEMLQIPVVLSWRAADLLPDSHPLYVGRPGIIASRSANFAQQNCDFLLILGTRLDLCQVGFNPSHFAYKAEKYMVDIDETEIAKFDIPIHRQVVDAKAFIEAMIKKHLNKLGSQPFLKRCNEWKKEYPIVFSMADGNPEGLVNSYHFIDVLSEIIPNDAVLIPGSSGSCAEITMQSIKVKQGLRIYNTPGLGSMGFCLPAVIGAAIASKKKVIGIVGDGGVMHNIQDLETIARLNLSVILFIWNNNGYASIRNMQRRRFNGHLVACDSTSGLTIPDFSKLVPAFGLKYNKISNSQNLKEQMQQVLSATEPLVCEVLIDPDIKTEPHLSSKVMPDGTMQSMPMENLAPFLSDEELAENMKDGY